MLGLSGVTRNEILRRLPHASKSFLKRNAQDCSDNQAPSPKSKRFVRDDALGPIAREEENPSRVRVRVISFRRRLIDPDNLCPKWHIDCLRYTGYIRGDRAEDIILEVSQQKVATKEEEHTRIEIEPILPPQFYSSVMDMDRQMLIEYYWMQCAASWNRQAFDSFIETLSDLDLRYYITYGQIEKS